MPLLLFCCERRHEPCFHRGWHIDDGHREVGCCLAGCRKSIPASLVVLLKWVLRVGDDRLAVLSLVLEANEVLQAGFGSSFREEGHRELSLALIRLLGASGQADVDEARAALAPGVLVEFAVVDGVRRLEGGGAAGEVVHRGEAVRFGGGAVSDVSCHVLASSGVQPLLQGVQEWLAGGAQLSGNSRAELSQLSGPGSACFSSCGGASRGKGWRAACGRFAPVTREGADGGGEPRAGSRAMFASRRRGALDLVCGHDVRGYRRGAVLVREQLRGFRNAHGGELEDWEEVGWAAVRVLRRVVGGDRGRRQRGRSEERRGFRCF